MDGVAGSKKKTPDVSKHAQKQGGKSLSRILLYVTIGFAAAFCIVTLVTLLFLKPVTYIGYDTPAHLSMQNSALILGLMLGAFAIAFYALKDKVDSKHREKSGSLVLAIVVCFVILFAGVAALFHEKSEYDEDIANGPQIQEVIYSGTQPIQTVGVGSAFKGTRNAVFQTDSGDPLILRMSQADAQADGNFGSLGLQEGAKYRLAYFSHARTIAEISPVEPESVYVESIRSL